MHHGDVELVGIDELAATTTTRVAVHWRGHSSQKLAGVLADSDLSAVRWCCYLDEPVADFTAAGASKAVMLEQLRVKLGVAATETLAVGDGDGDNDLEMLAWAAHGVAMGHSPAPVLAVADEICPTGADDGLATALWQWFG